MLDHWLDLLHHVGGVEEVAVEQASLADGL